jgi:hypothetical protein
VLRQSGEFDPVIISKNRQRGWRVWLAAPVAALALVACSDGDGGEAIDEQPTSMTSLETTTTTCEQSPTAFDYSQSVEAAEIALNDSGFPEALNLLDSITDPTVAAQTQHAIALAQAARALEYAQESTGFEAAENLIDQIPAEDPVHNQVEIAVDNEQAEEAAWMAYQEDDFDAANAALAYVENADIKAITGRAIQTALLEHVLFNQINRNIAAWSQAESDAQTAQLSLGGTASVTTADIYDRADKAVQDLSAEAAAYCP